MLAAACTTSSCNGKIFFDEHQNCPECDAEITETHKKLFEECTENTVAKLEEMSQKVCK